jgi:hypothetical protein
MIKDKTKVAASARLDIDEVIVAHNDENFKMAINSLKS